MAIRWPIRPEQPAGANFNASTQTFTWTPTYDQLEFTQITFVAQDPSGAQGSAVAFIRSSTFNRPPVSHAGRAPDRRRHDFHHPGSATDPTATA